MKTYKWTKLKVFFLALFLFSLTACIKKTYTISFNLEGENIPSMEASSLEEIQVDKLPKPILEEGYFFSGWYFDSDFSSSVENFEVTSDIILFGYVDILDNYQALQDLEIPLEVDKNISLPSKVSNYSIVWTSSDNTLLTDAGRYRNTSLEDYEVTLNAKLVGTDFSKDFNITILAYPAEREANKIINGISFNTITKNIVLPKQYDLFSATWESNKPLVISDEGIVNLSQNEEEVILTLRLDYLSFTTEATFTVYTVAKQTTVNDSSYFANRVDNVTPDEVYFTLEDISFFNTTVLNTPKANTKDLSLLATSLSKAEVQAMIEAYTNINSYPVKDALSGVTLNASEKNLILLNRNLAGIDNIVEVKYAISTNHTNLRSYPTNAYASDFSIDRFQETGFGAAIPMIIYHTSLDQEWYFVRMFNYAGWVEAKNVALCNRDDFLSFVNPNDFIVIIDPILYIGDAPLRMGTRLPLDLDNKILFPTRSSSGNLVLINPALDATSFNYGYLDLNYLNLFNQAYKFLGYSYSWGDKKPDGLDCSSTQGAIYNCFGIHLGRNTSNQWVTNTYGQKLTNTSLDKLKVYPPGTLFYTSGHVLMYLGLDDFGTPWVLHNTSSGNICKLQTLTSYSWSSINNVLVIN